MKTIKIKYLDWWTGFNPNQYLINQILKKHYIVEETDTPDYVIASVYEKDALNYDCIRILYSAENFAPDFNLYDYGIGFERMIFEDRYLWFPNYLMNPKYKFDIERMKTKHLPSVISSRLKTEFCSCVISNGTGNQTRFRFLEELGKYKTVNSGGRYLNNIGLPEGVIDKYKFQEKHKFAFAFENSLHRGYCTEKLVEAFSAGCIPIYWGDPCVTEIFNEHAMVIVKENNFTEVIDKIKKIDEDDDLYIEMLKEPALVDSNCFDVWHSNLEKFLCNIFDKPIEEVRQRSTIPLVENYYKNLNFIPKSNNESFMRTFKKFRRQF